MTYEPFTGDGRTMAEAKWNMPGTCPMRVTHSEARRAIDAFRESGHSTHSGLGATLWVILEWCQRHKVAYTLSAEPGVGYHITRKVD